MTLSFRVDELVVNRGKIVEDLPLGDLDLDDRTFELPDDASTHVLEDSLQADGQQEPIIVRRATPGSRWQIVDGFRRVDAATRLGWPTVQARCFDSLSNEQAAVFAVRNVTVNLPQPETLEALAERLVAQGAGAAAAIVQGYLERLFQRGDVVVEDEEGELVQPAEAAAAMLGQPEAEPEQAAAAEVEEVIEEEGEDAEGDEEVTVDELAGRTLEQLSEISQDLSLVQENWADVSPELREKLVEHLQYFADLLPFLHGN